MNKICCDKITQWLKKNLAPLGVHIWMGPHTSEWTISPTCVPLVWVDKKDVRDIFPRRHPRQWLERWSLSLKRASPATLPNVAILRTVLWLRWPKRWCHKRERQLEQQRVPFQQYGDSLLLGCWVDIKFSFLLASLPWWRHRLERKKQCRRQRLLWGLHQSPYQSSKDWYLIQGRRARLSSFRADVHHSL